MANTNNLIDPNPKVIGAPYDEDSRLFPNTNTTSALRGFYDVTTEDIVALGAFTTGDIIIETLPAGANITYTRLELTEVADSSGDVLSAGTVQLTYNSANLGTGSKNIFSGSVGDVINDITGKEGVTTGTNALKLHFASLSGGNWSAVTAGSVRIWFDYVILFG